MNKPLLAATLLLAATSHLLAPATVVAAPAGTATARYNPSTGTMVLDVGSGLGILGITTEGKVNTGQYLHDPYPQIFDMNVIAYLNPLTFTPQIIRLEKAFVTGLAPSDFAFTYFVMESRVSVFPDVTIPEPNSPTLLTIGLVCGLWATRRRSS